MYDAYYNNSSSHVDAHTDYTFQSKDASSADTSRYRLEALFSSLLSKDLLNSSESMLCVSRTPAATRSYGVHTSPCNFAARRGMCGGIWMRFLSDLQASKDNKADVDHLVSVKAVPQHGVKSPSGMLLEEWMETCSAAMGVPDIRQRKCAPRESFVPFCVASSSLGLPAFTVNR